jgi:AcrR family transcriptional regulator
VKNIFNHLPEKGTVRMDIVGQLQEGLVRFSAQESRVAAFILKNLSFTASASIDELAASAGVSPATITRFARSVGCEDIRDLRKQLAQASERRQLAGAGQRRLPAAWRDALSYLGSTLAQQLANTSKRRWKSSNPGCAMPAPSLLRPRRPGYGAGIAAPASAAARRHRH